MFIDGKITIGQILTKVQEVQKDLFGKNAVIISTVHVDNEDSTWDIVLVSVSNKGTIDNFIFRSDRGEKLQAEYERFNEYIKKL